MTLKEECFAQGFQRGWSGITKQALTPRGASAVFPHITDMELEALGRRLFRDSHRAPGLLKGISSTLFSGYGQLRGIHDLAKTGIPDTAPAMVNAFTALGRTAKPRLDFVQRAVPAAGGAAAGGLVGAAMGHFKGQRDEHNNIADAMGNAPLMERIKYMLSPQQYTHPKPIPGDYQ